MQKGNAAYIKAINKKLVLQCIKEGDAITRADISKRLSLSKPTVSTIVNQLLESNLIYESGNGQATSMGGRKPVNLMFNPKQSYIIGIDIGGTNVTLGITDLNGDVCAYRDFPTQQHLGEHLFKEIKRNVESMIDQLRIEDKKILGIGVGTPGITNVAEGIVLEAPALKWKSFPIKDKMKEIFNLPIEVDNDVNINVLGEHWKGIGKDKSNLIYIAIGTGIGSGVMIKGNLYRGSNYSAGEIGYLVTDRVRAKEFHPVYEGYGFLESIASGSSISKQLLEKTGKNVTAKEAFALYNQGHEDAIEIINLALENLAIGLANYVSLFDPELIILGGGVSGSFSIIQKQITDIMKRYTPGACEIQQTTFGKEAGVIGAVALFLKEHETLLI
ncbi:ROK family transcriptional regulator [Lentibacillus sp. L22]|nr:ROK family transcriptional regulator [Lentibacillus daqui]